MSCDLPLNRALGVTEMVAEEAFIPLCRTQNEPYAIIVRSDSDIQSLEDMVAVAQSGPEALSIGITGIGTGNGLACLTFQEYFDCTLKLVPFDSAADAHGGCGERSGGHDDQLRRFRRRTGGSR